MCEGVNICPSDGRSVEEKGCMVAQNFIGNETKVTVENIKSRAYYCVPTVMQGFTELGATKSFFESGWRGGELSQIG